MIDNVRNQYAKGQQTWGSIQGQHNELQKLQAFALANGNFATVLTSKELPAEVVGTIGFFYYQYTACLAQNNRNADANRYYKVTKEVCARAIKQDSHELYARFTLLCIATTEIPTKPDTLGTLLNGKSLFSKMFNASSELTEYNICKGNAARTLEDFRLSYAAKLSEGMPLETCTEILERIITVFPILTEHGIDCLPTYTTLISTADHVDTMTTILETDAEITEALEQLEQAIDTVEGQLNAHRLTHHR